MEKLTKIKIKKIGFLYKFWEHRFEILKIKIIIFENLETKKYMFNEKIQKLDPTITFHLYYHQSPNFCGPHGILLGRFYHITVGSNIKMGQVWNTSCLLILWRLNYKFSSYNSNIASKILKFLKWNKIF